MLRFLAVLLLIVPAAATAQTAPRWTRGATCYEVFVRSFYDSDGDGIGDLRGLTQKLDYLNDGNPRSTTDLGVRCLWLMPVTASPSYHGYDVTDEYRVNPEYGTNEDFKRLVAAAHRRGIRVLVDVMLNHVSNRHPAFQAALGDTASPFRSWFRFSPSPGRPNRWGGINWRKSPAREEYYYGFFSERMPDLNYDRPEALAEMKKAATFWLREMGADGFRLDAVKYLVEEGDRVDDTPGTHRVLRDYAAHVRRVKPGAFTIGEVYDSIGATLPYYPDQLDGYFAFEVADSLIAAVRTGSSRGLLAPVLRLQRLLPAYRWSPFLRNHDQPRTRTELGDDGDKARLAAALLLTLPGLPFVYYGEELGMTGPKPDQLIRTPMGWTADGPHAGFTTGTPWERMRDDSLTANVAVQAADSTSLLALYRRLIHLRAAHPALAAGTLIALDAGSDAALAFVRRDGSRAVIVVANLGPSPLTGVALGSDLGALPPGRYRPHDALGAGDAAPLTIGPTGRLSGYVPLPVLAPMTAFVFDLTPVR